MAAADMNEWKGTRDRPEFLGLRRPPCKGTPTLKHSQVSLHKLLDEVDLVELVEAWGRDNVEDGDNVLVAAG